MAVVPPSPPLTAEAHRLSGHLTEKADPSRPYLEVLRSNPAAVLPMAMSGL